MQKAPLPKARDTTVLKEVRSKSAIARRNKAKARDWENEIAAFYREHGYEAKRDPRRSRFDKADIWDMPHLATQAKDTQGWSSIEKHCADAAVQANNKAIENNEATFPIVFRKKQGSTKAQDGYIVMKPAVFMIMWEIVIWALKNGYLKEKNK